MAALIISWLVWVRNLGVTYQGVSGSGCVVEVTLFQKLWFHVKAQLLGGIIVSSLMRMLEESSSF